MNWAPLSLGKGLVAPAWATTLGWLLTLSSVSLLPIWAIYALATTPGTLPQVAPALSLIYFAPRTTIKHSTNCDFFDPPQRFKRLCSPANNSSLALRHFPTNNSAPRYTPALPLTEKPKEPITDLIRDHMK